MPIDPRQLIERAIAATRAFLATQPRNPLVVILGPTASGKTALAIALAQTCDGEIVSADSRAIYRETDIGTAKPTTIELAAAPHHLVSVAAPDEVITLPDYRRRAEVALKDIAARGRLPILAGSHTLLISAIIEQYDFPAIGPTDHALRDRLEAEYDAKHGAETLWEELAHIDPATSTKIPPQNRYHLIRALELIRRGTIPSQTKRKSTLRPETLLLGLNPPRDALYAKIDARVDAMMADGLLDEVTQLSKKYDRYAPALRGHGYRELLDYFAGEKSLAVAIDEIKRDTRHYAKRQMTWWKNRTFAEQIVWLMNEIPV